MVLFNKWCWESWTATCKRMKLEHSLTPYTKIKSKWIKDLNVRPDTIKLLEKNIGRSLYDINHSKILFDPPPREMEIKRKINKWDLMKLETINKTKRQPSEWEKIFANEATDKGLISKIYKQLMQLNTKKTKQPNPKMGRRPQQVLLQRRYTDCQQTMKGCSTSLIIGEMQIKTMMYHLTLVRMAIIKKFTNSKCWRGCGEKGTLLHCWWECKLIQPLWRAVWRFLKKLKI